MPISRGKEKEKKEGIERRWKMDDGEKDVSEFLFFGVGKEEMEYF